MDQQPFIGVQIGIETTYPTLLFRPEEGMATPEILHIGLRKEGFGRHIPKMCKEIAPQQKHRGSLAFCDHFARFLVYIG